MTVTVKLDAMLEEQLRQRAAASGATASDVIRAALQAYLSSPDRAAAPSSHDLGAGLFGRYRGTPGLAERRKALLTEAWSDKHASRRKSA